MADPFVVDNSVVMTWCFEDETTAYGDSVLDRLSKTTAVVPAIWPLEVTNVLLVAERRGRLAAADSARFVSLLLRLPIAVEHWHPERIMKEVLDLGREKKLSSYDASYLSLAMTKGYPIATIDTNMLKAARELGVEVLSTHNT